MHLIGLSTRCQETAPLPRIILSSGGVLFGISALIRIQLTGLQQQELLLLHLIWRDGVVFCGGIGCDAGLRGVDRALSGGDEG